MDPIDMLHAKVDELAIVMLNAKMDKLARVMDDYFGNQGIEEVNHTFYGCHYCGGPHQNGQCPSYFDEGLYYTQGNSDQWPYQGGYNDWMPQQQHSEFPWSDQPYYCQEPPPPPPPSKLELIFESYMQAQLASNQANCQEPPPPPPPSEFQAIVESYMQAQLASNQAKEDRLNEVEDSLQKMNAQLEEMAASQKATENHLAQMISSGRFEAYGDDEEYQKEDESDVIFPYNDEDDEIPLTKPIEEVVEQIVEQGERDGCEEVPLVKHVMEVVGEDFKVVDDIPVKAKVENISDCAPLSDKPYDEPYILEFILEPKVWNVEGAQYHLGLREPTVVKKAKMSLRKFPQYRRYH